MTDFFGLKMKSKGRSKKHGQGSPAGQATPQHSHSRQLKSARAERVQTEQLSRDDVVIAVMGPTGSGKSTFISLATGSEMGIGHTLQSCTSEISMVRLKIPGGLNLVFVDTPGFDDTNRSDSDILKMISDWLAQTYKQKILLSGLLYLHRINDNRMGNTPLKNLKLFKKLCGHDALENIILTTTMWEEESLDQGVEREKELEGHWWKSMIEQGSVTRRFDQQTQEVAFRVLEPLLHGAVQRHSLLIQKEILDMRLNLPETSAGQALYSELALLAEKRQGILRKMLPELQGDIQDRETSAALKQEYKELQENLESLFSELRALKLPIGQRLLKTFSSAFHIARR